MFVRVGILMVFSRSILVLFGSYAFWNLVGGARPTKTRHSQLFLFKAAWSLLGELVALYRCGYPQSALSSLLLDCGGDGGGDGWVGKEKMH